MASSGRYGSGDGGEGTPPLVEGSRRTRQCDACVAGTFCLGLSDLFGMSNEGCEARIVIQRIEIGVLFISKSGTEGVHGPRTAQQRNCPVFVSSSCGQTARLYRVTAVRWGSGSRTRFCVFRVWTSSAVFSTCLITTRPKLLTSICHQAHRWKVSRAL